VTLKVDIAIDRSPRDPLIPYATNLSEGLPARTESKIIATVPMSDLGTFNITLTTKPAESCFTDITSSEYSEIGLPSPQTLNCVVDRNVPTTVSALFLNGLKESIYTLKNPVLHHSVFLQLSYYYNLVAQYQLTQNSSKTVSSEWTYGMDVSRAQSFTNTLGYSATIEVGGNWNAFSASASATVSNEFSSTYTSSTTISSSTMHSETNEFAPTGNGTYLYGIWQRVEVFQFVDEEGTPWDVSDLGYDFAEDPGNNGNIFGFESRLSQSVYEITTYDIFY